LSGGFDLERSSVTQEFVMVCEANEVVGMKAGMLVGVGGLLGTGVSENIWAAPSIEMYEDDDDDFDDDEGEFGDGDEFGDDEELEEEDDDFLDDEEELEEGEEGDDEEDEDDEL
jgi:hypothetical protein